jgi:hypothetical protein
VPGLKTERDQLQSGETGIFFAAFAVVESGFCSQHPVLSIEKYANRAAEEPICGSIRIK